MKNLLLKIIGNFLDKLRKILPEWNAHLEIFSHIQAIENSWQSCFSEQIFYRKQSLGAPHYLCCEFGEI